MFVLYFKNIYSLDGIMDSSFYKGELIGTKNNENQLWSLRNWTLLLGLENIDKGIVVKEKSALKKDIFIRKGVAYEFSKLKTDKDINAFAKKYGLLGISTPSPYEARDYHKRKQLFGDSIYLAIPYGNSNFEPLMIWKFYIDQIRKILKLYKTLVNIHNGTEKELIEGNLLNIGVAFDEDDPKYLIEWWDGTQTGIALYPELVDNGDFLEIARRVLIDSVNYQAKRRSDNIAVDIMETDKPPLGFYVQESRVTPFLINVIYHDLWDLISKNEPVYICENPKCKLPFPKVKRQKFCCDACKSDAYRQRKATAQTMALEGHSIDKIAEFLNVKTESVQKWIKM
jgi:hypothetical protein